MQRLAARRPIFHSEADFQLAIAWEIQLLKSGAQIRLERRVLADPVVVLDLLVVLDGVTFALELKYLKARLEIEIDAEPFRLREGASDVERYDILRDVVRLERLVDHGLAEAGCALVLTNASGFWRPGGGRATAFDEFRVHEGRTVAGPLGWGPNAGPGTRRGRDAAVELRGSYACRWQPYSRVTPRSGGEFRYLAIVIGKGAHGDVRPAAA